MKMSYILSSIVQHVVWVNVKVSLALCLERDFREYLF